MVEVLSQSDLLLNDRNVLAGEKGDHALDALQRLDDLVPILRI